MLSEGKKLLVKWSDRVPVPESSKAVDSQFSRAGNVGKLLLIVPRFCSEGAVAGVREGVNSLWFLDC